MPDNPDPFAARVLLIDQLDEAGDVETNMQALALLAASVGLRAYIDSNDPNNVQLFVAQTDETFPDDIEDEPRSPPFELSPEFFDLDDDEPPKAN